ncbi:MAG: hypothetical protein CM15mP83_2540 [Flavobacteriaceae bacterium]|nr:MAG: hypothetical protein CM15mP83_2540 [Flavobacteriaceae bacterium]
MGKRTWFWAPISNAGSVENWFEIEFFPILFLGDFGLFQFLSLIMVTEVNNEIGTKGGIFWNRWGPKGGSWYPIGFF